MKMTPALLILGALMVFWTSVFVAVFLPAMTMDEPKSEIWRKWTKDEEEGHRLYNANGCSYCHSQFVRTIDWDVGSERIAQRGDYIGMQPIILGTERTGPDLSQEGGEHPDDWHIAHFTNPRFTRPESLMPSWEFLGPDAVQKLTAYMQAEGGKAADWRMDEPGRGQRYWKKEALAAYRSGPDKNIQWLHAHVQGGWADMTNPYPATPVDLDRGERIYQQYCINCHGSIGDGQGRAVTYRNPPLMEPPPLNFGTIKRNLATLKDDKGEYHPIGGIFYYQIMNGITGTAMPYFKRELASEKIWDVSNYLAIKFVGYSDSTRGPRGIPASYEPPWTPASQPATGPGREGVKP